MFKTMKNIARVSIAVTALVAGGAPVLADGGDVSTDARRYTQRVEVSEAVIIRVPVNSRGEENTAAAVMRLYDGNTVTESESIKAAFDRAQGTDGIPTFTNRDSSTNRDELDSSTWGWYGYRNYGWYNNYYYNYRPYYYYGGYSYSYGNPYYYNYYSSPYSYRYYYYPYSYRYYW